MLEAEEVFTPDTVLAAIVVRKDTGYPGGGFFCWDGVPPALRRARREGSNPRLSDAEKRHVRKFQRRPGRGTGAQSSHRVSESPAK